MTRRSIEELGCFCFVLWAIIRGQETILKRWSLNTGVVTLDSHRIGGKRWIALPLIFRMYFVSQLKHFFESSHVFFLILEQISDLSFEDIRFPVDLSRHFDDHLLKSIIDSQLFGLVIIDVVFFGEILQSFEGQCDLIIVFDESLVYVEEILELLSQSIILDVDLAHNM